MIAFALTTSDGHCCGIFYTREKAIQSVRDSFDGVGRTFFNTPPFQTVTKEMPTGRFFYWQIAEYEIK